MKRLLAWLLVLACVPVLVGCGVKTINTLEGNLLTYEELSDGTWQCNGHIYQYRLEITGKLPNTSVDTTYVYLSNTETISFEKAMMASGLSSYTEDYFDAEEAVLVEIR